MKQILFFLIMSWHLNAFSQDFTIVQINAKWNIKNNWIVPQMDGINYQFAYLEDQKNEIKSKINAVPVVIMYKGNKPIHQWNADLSFKLELDQEKICAIISKHQ